MDINQDLIGKTITGVIASVSDRQSPREIWLLQFSDGTHVEFVSPGSRRALRRTVRRPERDRGTGALRSGAKADAVGQLTLNVA